MKHGFTLMEIMLSLLVIAVGILALIGLLGSSLDTSAKAREDLDIVSFSEMIFNYYHASTNWQEIPPDGSWRVPDYAGGFLDLSESEYTAELPEGGRRMRFFFSADRPDPHLKALTLKVYPGRGTNELPRIFCTEIYNWNRNP